MQLPALLIADLHLVESPSCEYRWGLWPWLSATIREERVATLVIAGDLTDKKDYHPSELVNRIVRCITDLKRDHPQLAIYIIPGNHDWLKDGQEYFRFLGHLPGVHFFTEPREDEQPGKGPLAMFLPFTKTPAADWRGLDFQHYDYVFMHQTVRGSIASNGMEMEGEELVDLRSAGKVYSGDIHVPQVVSTPWGKVEYIGSPYHVHFGDDFKPRAVLLEKGGRAIDLHFKSPRRIAIKVSGLEGLRSRLRKTDAGDQVKATIVLDEADKHMWGRIRREASLMLEQAEVDVHGLELQVEHSDRRITAQEERVRLSPGDALLRFVQAESLTPDAYEIAMEVIDERPQGDR